MIDYFKRYQAGLKLVDLYPIRNDRMCACGCGVFLDGRKKRWASESCQSDALNNFLIIKGDTFSIRANLYDRDNGFCCSCGVLSDNWHADHIVPVFKGGSACGLDNFQTLCIDCHNKKTREQFYFSTESHLLTISSQAS